MIKSLYPIFQRWSSNGSVWIISDTHFDDGDREYMGYTISTQEHVDIVKRVVCKNDTLIHLGDVGDLSYIKRLKCYKVLIMGNHDQSIEKMQKIFDEVYSGPLWISDKLVLSHEPLRLKDNITTWTDIAFNIHGHDHNWGDFDDYHLDLAQNIFGYFPLNLKNFINSGKLKKIKNIHRVTIDYASSKPWSYDPEILEEFLKRYRS